MCSIGAMTMSYFVRSESLKTTSTPTLRRQNARYQRRTVATYCLSWSGPTAASIAHQLFQSNMTATRANVRAPMTASREVSELGEASSTAAPLKVNRVGAIRHGQVAPQAQHTGVASGIHRLPI